MASGSDLTKVEGFEWGKGNLEHIKKRGVEYTECEEVFSNIPLLFSGDKTHSKSERRSRVLGQTNDERLLFIALTIRNNKIRVISARDQSKEERDRYKKARVINL